MRSPERGAIPSQEITFEDARAISVSSPEVLQYFDPGGIEIASWGWENSTDYILTARQLGEPWYHELAERPIPGPPMIVVSKTTGEVRTFIGGSVPEYYRGRDGDEGEAPIGDAPD